ncbi:MAG: tRNA lysidine(34) synthetase TilS [Candidatus Omnitrophica bacterium]|nr:tRNA lysidine(34) synthetase TilS [Candidatus Omnitrophota bacterium]
MGEDLIAQVRRTIARHRLVPPRERIVVAVSGGADSVALLHILLALRPILKPTLHIAHLDHSLRQGSSDDAGFVRELGARCGVPATIERRDVGAVCERRGWSLEDGARKLRYEFLLEVARRASAGCVALAHTADDQAETVLMRLVRGTGLTGLCAMPIKRRLDDGVWLVRPLLEVWRREVTAYLQEAGLAHREDPTNDDRRFIRNRIRRELLPLLEQDYNPNIKKVLAQLAQLSQWDYAYLQEASGRQWKRMAKGRTPAQVALSIALFRRQPKALQRQLVRQSVLRIRGDLTAFEFRHWLEVERLFFERPVGTLVGLPGGVQLRREQDRVLFERATVPPQPDPATQGLAQLASFSTIAVY